MHIELSIIMPCYNCERTLQEAVESCYAQGFSPEEFEIVMVDDVSTDNTQELLKKLAAKHKNIRLFFHEKNKGGGAARNTAVSHTKSDFIFCLDSDDLLPPRVLSKMVSQLQEQHVDGVLFAETKYFTTDTSKTTTVPNTQPACPIELKHLYENDYGYLTQTNFLYTKDAFNSIGGYPTNHGFDTQTFGLLFLAKQHTVSICPDTFYYHRQSTGEQKSYYQREYERGLLSINSYLALEPILENLHSELIEQIIHFDVFKKNYHGADSHFRTLITKYIREQKPLLHDPEKTHSHLSATYVTMCRHLQKKEYKSAQDAREECLKTTKKETPLLHYAQLRISCGQQGVEKNNINEAVAEILQSTNVLHQPKYNRLPRIFNPLLFIYRIIKNKYEHRDTKQT